MNDVVVSFLQVCQLAAHRVNVSQSRSVLSGAAAGDQLAVRRERHAGDGVRLALHRVVLRSPPWPRPISGRSYRPTRTPAACRRVKRPRHNRPCAGRGDPRTLPAVPHSIGPPGDPTRRSRELCRPATRRCREQPPSCVLRSSWFPSPLPRPTFSSSDRRARDERLAVRQKRDSKHGVLVAFKHGEYSLRRPRPRSGSSCRKRRWRVWFHPRERHCCDGIGVAETRPAVYQSPGRITAPSCGRSQDGEAGSVR